MDSDDFYQEFVEWCVLEEKPTNENDPPSLWKRFTPEAMKMFSRILALDAERRCTVGEVRSYVEKDWLKEETGREQGLSSRIS